MALCTCPLFINKMFLILKSQLLYLLTQRSSLIGVRYESFSYKTLINSIFMATVTLHSVQIIHYLPNLHYLQSTLHIIKQFETFFYEGRRCKLLILDLSLETRKLSFNFLSSVFAPNFSVFRGQITYITFKTSTKFTGLKNKYKNNLPNSIHHLQRIF